MSSFNKYASVLLDLGLDAPFDYGVPQEFLETLQKGMCVEVLLRGKKQTGIVLGFKDLSRFSKVLPIEKIISEKPLMTPKLFEMGRFMAKYYNCPLSKTLKLFFPKSVRKGMEAKQQKIVLKNKTAQELRELCVRLRTRSPAQAKALDVLLMQEKEIFLTELLELSKVSSSAVLGLEKKGALVIQKAFVSRNPLEKAEYFPSKPKTLNTQQENALTILKKALDQKKFAPHLLYGVTGSGKTEVYMQAIDHALKLGEKTLLLVPEIALTTQTIEKFKSRFKDKMAVLHHRLSQGERYDTWHEIASGKVSIAIGARSAIFAPFDKLGLLIVDEEHESSYKQSDEMPTYHARDLAVLRAKMNQATLILGSATPSLETYTNCLHNKYHIIKLSNRVLNQKLPKVECVDMRLEVEKNKGFTLFSSRLLSEIKLRLKKGEQTILFLNRRGYHASLMCPECGLVEKCPHCEISLTFHRSKDLLSCHLCDFCKAPPKLCRDCQSPNLKFKGIGTENVEASLKKIFPEIKTLRMDGDTTKHVGSYEKLYYAFRNQKADVLIGTQMIAKGLHFPNVTLVGVLNSDQPFNLPDYKASESAFQMIVQVAGRAGRGDVEGLVLLQTFNKNNPILKDAIAQDYSSFYEKEIASRRFFNFPPQTHLIKIVFKGKFESQTLKYAKQLYQAIKTKILEGEDVMEPLPCGYAKVKDYYRFQIILKGHHVFTLNEKINFAITSTSIPNSIRLLIDVDPSSTFF